MPHRSSIVDPVGQKLTLKDIFLWKPKINLGVLQARPRRDAQQAPSRPAVAGLSEHTAQRNPDSAGCERPRAAGEAVSPPKAANGCLPCGPAERLPGGLRTKREGLTRARNCARERMERAGLGAEGAPVTG